MVHWFSPLLVVAAVSAFPFADRRDVNTVLGNLETIDTQAIALTSSINSWDGSLLGALGISSASDSLNTAINDANTQAQTEAQFSSADSQILLTYVTGTLAPDTQAALDALVARESDVTALGVTSIVLSQVQTLQTSVSALGATLVSISSADTQAAAQAAVDALNAGFDAAVAAYS